MRDRRGTRGQTLPVIVFCMFTLIGVAGAAIDVASWYQSKRSLQSAADAAALAAASQIPSGWSSALATGSSQYAKNGRAGDSVTYTANSVASPNDSVVVTATRRAPSYFSRVFGIGPITVTATARATVSSFTTVHSNQDIMPWGVMKNSFVVGQSYSLYTDNSSSNNGALSLPYVNGSNCPVPNGANPYRDEIDGSLNACPVSVGEQLDVKPGDNAGPTRQGIDDRITSWKPLDQIVQISPSGQATVVDSSSKQLVLIPIVEDPDGGTDWLNGSGWVRVVGFAWFVITGPPGYTNNGKTVTGVFVGLEDVATTGDQTGPYKPGTNTSYTISLTQ
ncbi:MAG TPA: pilus assembly protein TadG-related protein [Gaiellales bacterium]|jgi:Putative Flp pilus-assembly TadE/G-like|nr:pilus assembly protein TadG-related protein [Gaiellales bacterium]